MEELARAAVESAVTFYLFEPITEKTLVSLREMIIGQIASDCEQGHLDGIPTTYPLVLLDISYSPIDIVFCFYFSKGLKVQTIPVTVRL